MIKENNQRIEAEALLSLYRQAAQTAHLICWEWDIPTNLMTVVITEPLSFSLEDFMKKIHPEDMAHFHNNLYATLEKGVYYEPCFRLVDTSGLFESYCGKGHLFTDKYNQPSKVIGVWILEDKGSKKILAQRVSRLMAAAQTCSMRELASMFSHQISQPLTVINSYLAGCLYTSDISKPTIIEAMKKAIENVEFAGKLLHSLKNNIRKTELIYTDINLNYLIELAVGWVLPDPAYPYIKITYDLDTNLPHIQIDMTQIKIVIINLLNNAIEAMQDAHIDNPILHIKTKKLDQDNVTFLIEDNGDGIPTTIEKNLFTSCLSTKEKKIGMGLATSRGIIDEHKGTITYTRLNQCYTCFQVTLPIKRPK